MTQAKPVAQENPNRQRVVLLATDSVEKVAPLSGLRQNICIGQQGSAQHDGTVIEWAGSAVLLVQP
jgi:hypothetical protein